MKAHTIVLLIIGLVTACAQFSPPAMKVDAGTVEPGSSVTLRGNQVALTGTPIRLGQPLPDTKLIEAGSMEEVNLAGHSGKILFLSIVPSIDTKVCEAQSHYLAEQGRRMPSAIERITISRDTPFAQQRFATEAKLTNIRFLSDYQEGTFGRSIGMLQAGSRLLARGIILVDRSGVVRYIQVVPELTSLPDMERAFDRAIELAKK